MHHGQFRARGKSKNSVTMKRSGSSTTSLTDMGVSCPNADNKLNIFESGEEGTLDYRLRFAMEEHAHRCACMHACIACIAKKQSSVEDMWNSHGTPPFVSFMQVECYVRVHTIFMFIFKLS